MMTTIEVRNELDRDTTICGGPKTWFPMRVTYRTEDNHAETIWDQ